MGGLRLPGDETGDCHIFTNRLAELAKGLGVEFRFSTTIDGLDVEAGRVRAVRTGGGPVAGDAVVLALGSFSPALAKTLGLRLPIYPVKGYSITAPITDETRAPVSTVLDESYKIAITRLGNRIPVGGMAELSGYNMRLSDSRRATLAFCVNELFPAAGDTGSATFWTGMRPDDARRHADPRAGRAAKPLHQFWPRHPRLDHGVRLGPRHRRHSLRKRPEIDMDGLGLARYR